MRHSLLVVCFFFFFKQKTAYEIVSGDWSSDVCSSDLRSQPAESPGTTATRWSEPSYLQPAGGACSTYRRRIPQSACVAPLTQDRPGFVSAPPICAILRRAARRGPAHHHLAKPRPPSAPS